MVFCSITTMAWIAVVVGLLIWVACDLISRHFFEDDDLDGCLFEILGGFVFRYIGACIFAVGAFVLLIKLIINILF